MFRADNPAGSSGARREKCWEKRFWQALRGT
jgi:hypothetical protein